MKISSSEVEFVDTSQAGQEVLYLRALLRGFGYPQKGAFQNVGFVSNRIHILRASRSHLSKKGSCDRSAIIFISILFRRDAQKI